ncbi:protein kinase [bacterium]|nr:protein kinase [candidate division CSSED10-310 bacterium]
MRDTRRIPTRIGKYDVISILGYGGMGVVYKVRNPAGGPPLALKTPHHHIDDPRLRTRFQRECRVMAGLDHPNIVRVLDYGEMDGMPCLVMEFIDGVDLESLLGDIQRSILTPGETSRLVTIMKGICQALEYLHQRRILHRDLKISNIMIAADGTVKLMDFGLVREIDIPSELTNDILIGSLNFMSPEQALHEPMDNRSDLFSLGIIFYIMVTCHNPFECNNFVRTLQSLVRDDPPRPSSLVEGLPPDLEEIILKLLAKKPADRFQSAAAVAERLEHLDPAPVAPLTAPLQRTAAGAPPVLMPPGFVGRDEELRRLLQFAYDFTGGPVGLLVSGEQGMGKSRLLREFVSFCEHNKVLLLPGAFSDPQSGTCEGLVEVLSVAAEIIEQLDLSPARYLSEREVTVLASLSARLGKVLNLRDATDALTGCNGAAAEVTRALLKLLMVIAHRRPVILLLENLQWMDGVSAVFIRALLGSVDLGRHRIKLLGTFRPEERWRGGGLTSLLNESRRFLEVLPLPPLGREVVREMVAAMLSSSAVAPDVAGYLFEQAGGNPFMVQEFLSHFLERGVVLRDHDGWRLERSSGLHGLDPQGLELSGMLLPESLVACMERRLEDLGSDEMALLRVGAALGDPFPVAPLAPLLEHSEEQVLDMVEKLLARRLLVEQHRDDGEWLGFTSRLTRTVVYNGMNKPRRRRLHRLIFLRLEQLHANPSRRIAELLLYHARKAQLSEMVLLYSSLLDSL